MKPNWRHALIVVGAALVLGAVNFAIAGKERIKQTGEVAYLRLAPVDPRSLMQGDYMALRFALVQQLEGGATGTAPGMGQPARSEGEIGFASVVLDDKHVASLAQPDSPAPLKLRYRIRGGRVWLGTNAFFFEEGSDQRYSAARYGEFRVDRHSGEAVLVGLRNEALEAL